MNKTLRIRTSVLEAVDQSADTVLHSLFGRQILHEDGHRHGLVDHILVDELADGLGKVQVDPYKLVIFKTNCPRRFRRLRNIRLDDIAFLAPVISGHRNKRNMFFTLAASFRKPAVTTRIVDIDTVKSQRDMVIKPFVKIKFIVRGHTNQCVYWCFCHNFLNIRQ